MKPLQKIELSILLINLRRSKLWAPDHAMLLYLNQTYEYKFPTELGPSFIGWLLQDKKKQTPV